MPASRWPGGRLPTRQLRQQLHPPFVTGCCACGFRATLIECCLWCFRAKKKVSSEAVRPLSLQTQPQPSAFASLNQNDQTPVNKRLCRLATASNALEDVIRVRMQPKKFRVGEAAGWACSHVLGWHRTNYSVPVYAVRRCLRDKARQGTPGGD